MKDNYGRANAKSVKKLEKLAVAVENLESRFSEYTDKQLAEMTEQFRKRYSEGTTLDELMPEAFAVCREASRRVLHQRHYHVQILGGIALHQGRICQMATGEGKTLTETLPAYLNAISGLGVHIVTVNEYLAARDMEWMGKVFRFLGLTVGVTLNKMTLREKQAAYRCDITYGTNNEFGFDYLRDNMASSRENRVQRGLNFVIIDEVDSILIDEARTPLIISGPSGKSSQMYVSANKFACTLQKDKDYEIDEKDKTVRLTDDGIVKAEKFFNVDNLSDPENMELNHYVNNAVRAHAIMKRDDDYIVEKGQVIIVDTFTGRKMEGRRYSGGLHQAIEAKEHVSVRQEDRTLATITFQNFFRLYRKMSGMTGTAKTEEGEFNTIYNIDVVVIPTNLPMIREDRADLVFSTRNGKLTALVEEIKQRHAAGQPMLIGTVTVEKSEELSRILTKEGIKHNVLNAKNHQREAEIVAQAGRLGAVTIATNMAGRGTDILLGGNPEFLAKQEMVRQGYTEEQIDLATSFAEGDAEQEQLKKVYGELLLKYKGETDAEKEKVISAGGLCVIGTERHDSRRIDDQLRGRSGRQGDPGMSVFYMSAEDDMLRIFGGETMKRIMTFMRIEENVPIESKVITRQIESAQKRIEGIHFDSRKHVLQYDDVNNLQRKVIYKERNKVLDGEDVHEDILAMADDYARKALETACRADENVREWDLDEVNGILSKFIPTEEPPLERSDLTNAREVHKKLAAICRDILNERAEDEQLSETDVPFREAERFVLLTTIDRLWMDHIEALDDLRRGVGLQAIGQHDPLIVFKKEAYDMFNKLNEEIEMQTLRTLFFGKVRRNISAVVKQKTDENPEKALNRPCPCGSGKKYKNCCYLKDRAAARSDSEGNPDAAEESRPLTKQEEYALKRQRRKESKQAEK